MIAIYRDILQNTQIDILWEPPPPRLIELGEEGTVLILGIKMKLYLINVEIMKLKEYRNINYLLTNSIDLQKYVTTAIYNKERYIYVNVIQINH